MPRLKLAPTPSLVPSPKVPHATATAAPSGWSWGDALGGALLGEEPRKGECSSFAPLGYERGYAYPLIVWLHADRSSEHDLPRVMRHVSVRNYVAVAPRGVVTRENGSYGWDQTSDSIAHAETAVQEAIETASTRFNLHDRRVFVAGSGAGGTMALRLGLRRPEWFAGAASLDGPLPSGGRPLGRINRARALPLMISSCRDSNGYPESQVCRDLSLLHSAGFGVAVRQYPGDDDLTTTMLADLDRWAMGIVCG